MVPLVKLWHFATKPDPERESRLLAFAKAPGAPTPGSTPDSDADLMTRLGTGMAPPEDPRNADAISDGVRSGMADVLQQAEREKELKRQMKEKLGNFGEKMSEKIAKGEFTKPMPVDANGDLVINALVEIFLEENVRHRPTYEALLLENDPARTVRAEYIDDLEKAFKAITNAVDAASEQLPDAFEKFLKEHPGARRSEAAVDAFALTQGPALQKYIQEHRDDFIASAHQNLTNPLTIRGADAIRKVDEVKAKIDDYIATLGRALPALKANIDAEADPVEKQKKQDTWNSLNGISGTLSGRVIDVDRMRERAKLIEEWQAGNKKPSSFGQHAAQIARYDIDRTDVETNFREKIAANPDAQDANWDQLNYATKIALPDVFQDDDATAVTLRDELQDIHTHMEDLEGEMKLMKVSEACDEFKKAEAQAEKVGQTEHAPAVAASLKDSISGFFDSLGIEFYTPPQLLKGWQMYWENRTAAKESTNRRKGAKFAQHVLQGMKLVTPFPDFNSDIEQLLKSAMDGEDGKEKSSYIDFLKGGPATFDDLFGSGNLYYSQQFNYNRTRAILEYAAEKGWLYDLHIDHNTNPKVVTAFGIRLVTGKNISPNDAEDVYGETLAQMQAGGESKARSHGKERVAHEESIPPIAAVLQEELDRSNYWAVEGIWEVALGKAKWGETPEYLHLILLNHLREHPKARKYLPKNLYDQLKNHGLLGLPGSMIDRDSMKNWQSKYADDNATAESHLSEAGAFAAATQKIEQKIDRILDASPDVPRLDTTQKMRLVSKVLAGQVLTGVPKDVSKDKEFRKWNGTISIYEDDFEEYRTMAATLEGGNILKMDDDYFDQRNGSSALLYGAAGIGAILNKRSQRDFAEMPKALKFLGQVTTRYDQLEFVAAKDPNMRAAFNNYKERMRKNFDEWVLGNMNDGSTMPFAEFVTYSVPIASDGTVPWISSMESMGKKGFAFAELAKRGMISKAVLQTLCDEKGQDFALKVASQAGITLRKKKSAAPKAA